MNLARTHNLTKNFRGHQVLKFFYGQFTESPAGFAFHDRMNLTSTLTCRYMYICNEEKLCVQNVHINKNKLGRDYSCNKVLQLRQNSDYIEFAQGF